MKKRGDIGRIISVPVVAILIFVIIVLSFFGTKVLSTLKNPENPDTVLDVYNLDGSLMFEEAEFAGERMRVIDALILDARNDLRGPDLIEGMKSFVGEGECVFMQNGLLGEEEKGLPFVWSVRGDGMISGDSQKAGQYGKSKRVSRIVFRVDDVSYYSLFYYGLCLSSEELSGKKLEDLR
jgi:hypothetical protein